MHQIGYPNGRSATYSVQQELATRGWGHLSPRPWNRHDPENTFWWLVPGPEWPAYKYGKLFFSPDRAPDGHLFCGMHIERGLDRAIEEAYPSPKGRRLIMQNDWIWHNFFEDLGSTAVELCLRHVSREINQPVFLRIEAGFVDDPGSFDPQAPRPKWDVVSFAFVNQSFVLDAADTPSNLLNEVSTVRSLDMVMKAIPEIPHGDWVWIDCFIGSLFEKSSNGITDRNIWGAPQLYDKLFANLKLWIK
jgi:hypothetical protein